MNKIAHLLKITRNTKVDLIIICTDLGYTPIYSLKYSYTIMEFLDIFCTRYCSNNKDFIDKTRYIKSTTNRKENLVSQLPTNKKSLGILSKNPEDITTITNGRWEYTFNYLGLISLVMQGGPHAK